MTQSNILPFFVIGFPRSGTTALAEIINSSSQMACIPQEGHILYRTWRMLNRQNVLKEPIEDLVLDFKTTAQYHLIYLGKIFPGKGFIFSNQSIDSLVSTFYHDVYQQLSISKIYENVANAFFFV